MALGLQPFSDIAADGAPRLNTAAGEELVRVERAAALALGPRAPEPAGTLFITTRRVIWVSDDNSGKGYAVDFVAVSLHAVSRDPEAYPSPCIYMQIDTEAGSDEESDESDSEANGEIEPSKVTEMRIIPSDPDQLDGLFEAFSHCAELNPDPDAESDEENGWVHGDESDDDMTDGSGAGYEFSDVNPIGQTDDHDIAHAVVEERESCFFTSLHNGTLAIDILHNVKLPELLASVNMEEDALNKLHQKSLDIPKFLQRNQSSSFPSWYDDGPRGSDGVKTK